MIVDILIGNTFLCYLSTGIYFYFFTVAQESSTPPPVVKMLAQCVVLGSITLILQCAHVVVVLVFQFAQTAPLALE